MKKLEFKQIIREEINKILKEEIFKFYNVDESWDEEDDSLISAEYEFKTPNNLYIVTLNSFNYSPGYFELLFKTKKLTKEEIDPKYLEKTNENKVISVIQTISKIIDDFINEYGEREEINKIYIKGTDEKRKKIYNQLFPKYISPKNLSKIDIEK